MANVWFSVLVLIFVHNVFAYDCRPSNIKNILNCDQCMRCGSNWCSQPKNTNEHCFYHVNDDWCNQPEKPKQIGAHQQPGKTIDPIYAERSVFINKIDSLRFNYDSPVERQPSYSIYNTTQSFDNIEVTFKPQTCDGTKCKLDVVTKVSPGFCTTKSSDTEFIYLMIKVDNTTEAMIKYHVPCACSCSQIVVPKAQDCHGNGDFSCGVCSCYQGWSGSQCEISECGTKRGDVQCNNPLRDNVACSGNGECGPCDTCICYTDRPGWQYFDRDNYCSDICMDTSGCELCLAGARPGPCARSPDEAECAHDLMMLKYNETTALDRDDYDRLDWVSCNNTFKEPNCYVEYLAKKTEAGISIMVVKSCNVHDTGAFVGAAGTKVPIVVGVLAVLAAVAAAGGVLLWKHLHAVPPMPFSSPDYQNIDAEDCVGENPLYKSPTSTFTNPQFGKCS